jgi:hypothetical protein
MKYAELLAGRRLRFLEVSQVLILKVTLALSVIQTAFFDAFARHISTKSVQHIYLNISPASARSRRSCNLVRDPEQRIPML